MDKQLLIFDLETTSDDHKTARICQFAWQLRDGQSGHLIDHDKQYVNPGVPITQGAIEAHGITDKDVEDKPSFSFFAGDLEQLFNKDVVLCGYNNRCFDDLILESEFRRVEREVDLSKKPNIDVYAVVKHFYSFRLEDVVRLLLGEEMKNAHDAWADVEYTHKVFRELRKRHTLPDKASEVNDFLYPDFVDREGKIKWSDGQAVFTFGKLEGRTIEDAVTNEPGYLQWILGKDFPEDFKEICREALIGIYPTQNKKVAADG